MMKKKLRIDWSYIEEFPSNVYFFLFEDGTLSSPLIGVNRPTAPIITTLWGSTRYSPDERKEIESYIKD